MITCSSCGRENPPDFAFCPGCGSRQRAGDERDAGAVVCSVAGSAIGSETKPVDRTVTLAEERKVVTTLFCDLVGFTAHSEASDHELIDGLLQQYNTLARRLVEGHGAAVEKFIGDAVLAVFGFPRAHEDDAERAVRCALKLVGETGALTWPDGDPVQVRIGVNSGETYLHTSVDPASGETFLTGDAVNTAARLETAAPPGGVVVGELTHELSAHVVEYRELDPLRVKGKKEPVHAWLAKTAGESRSRTGIRTTGASDTPFVGREKQLGSLLADFDEAVGSCEARFVLLVGEPGIGKSRLVLEFARALDERLELITWRQGRSLAYGDASGFAALSEIVQAHAGVLVSDDAAVVEKKLEAVLPEDEDRAWLRQRLRPLLGLEAAEAPQEERFAAWTLFLAHIASAGPTVLVLEDLHWAGETMLAFVRHLATQDVQVPLFVLGTSRPELLQRWPELPAGGDGVSRQWLSPLTRRDVGRLVTALIGQRLAADVRRSIMERGGGNPLYAEEYVRLLLDRGLLVEAGGLLRLKAGEALPLPDCIQAVLAARMDTLPAGHKALLGDAAIFGETFWEGGVAALAGRSRNQVAEAMEALGRRQLIRRTASSSFEGETEYLFWHALARDVAYEQLPRRLRLGRHRSAAEWLECRAGDRVEDLAEMLAHHYVTALELAEALRDDRMRASLVDPSVRYLGLAGARSTSVDVVAAESHYARALRLCPDEHARRGQLLLGWANALNRCGALERSAAAYEAAVARLRGEGDYRRAAVAMTCLNNILMTMNKPTGTWQDEAVALLEGDGPSPELVEVLMGASFDVMTRGGDLRVARELAERALRTAEQAGLPVPARLLGHIGEVRHRLCGDAGGIEDVRRAMVAAEAQGRGDVLGLLKHNYIENVFGVQGPAAALRAAYDALEQAQRTGMESFVAGCRGSVVSMLFFSGRWDEAMEELPAVVAVDEQHRDLYNSLTLRAIEALLLAERGDAPATGAFLSRLVPEARRAEAVWVKVTCLVAAAAVRLRLADVTSARGLLEEVVAAVGCPWSDDFTDTVTVAVRTALAAGDAEIGARLAAGLHTSLPRGARAAASVSALLAEARGERGAAAAGFADAAAGWREFEMPYEEAQALLGQGRCLVALGRAPEAAPVLGAAREILARLGATPALEETDALLRTS